MSHYTVGVLVKIKDTDYIEEAVSEALEPFNENLEVEPYIRRTKQEIIDDVKEHQISLASKVLNGEELSDYDKKVIDAKDNEELLYDIGKDYDDEDHYDENGNEISTYNPNSKWDWWSIGGRWSGEICGNNDYCLVKDINLTPDQETYNESLKFWDGYVDETIPSDPEEFKNVFYSKDYYRDKYGTREKYAESCSINYTFALLVDGNWYEPGQMGWFACDNSNAESREEYHEKFKEIIRDPKYQDYYFVLVDCHI